MPIPLRRADPGPEQRSRHPPLAYCPGSDQQRHQTRQGEENHHYLESFSGRRSAGADKSPVENLTDREFEVFQLIGQGKGTRQIAEKLHLSVKTVEVHRVNIKTKLKLQSATELIRFAVRWVEGQAAG